MLSLLLCVVCFGARAVNINGSITNNQGAPVCALVLANGQFMFSCTPTGSYSLEVSPDAAGQITIFGFAEGHFPLKKVVTAGGRYDLVVTIASSSNPTTPTTSYDRTAVLVGGTWTYTYAIISIFSDSYTFTRVDPTPDSHGDYLAFGTSPSGRLVGGGWVTSLGQYLVLAPGTIIDQVYSFNLSGNNNASGCYYQISPPGSTNLSRCYSMTGFRSPPKSMMMTSDPERLLREVAMDAVSSPPDPRVLDAYLELRRGMQQ